MAISTRLLHCPSAKRLKKKPRMKHHINKITFKIYHLCGTKSIRFGGSFLSTFVFSASKMKVSVLFPSPTSNVISILMRWRHNVIRNNLHLTLTVYLPLPAQQLFNGQKLSLRAFFVMNLKPFVLWGAWQLLLPCWNLMNPNHLKLDIISYGVALSWREIHHKNLWYGFLFTAGDLNLSEIIKRNRMK